MIKNKKIQITAYLIILISFLILINIGSSFIINYVYGTSVFSQEFKDIKKQFYREKNQKPFVHPFFGLASTKDKIFESNLVNDYLFSEIDLAKNKDEIKVLVLGGSVAFFLSSEFEWKGKFISKKSIFYDELNEAFNSKRFSVYNAAFGGGKQPKSYFKLLYLDLIGFKPDLVINIDGFNEIALPLSENIDATIPAIYPRQFDRAILRSSMNSHCVFSNYLANSESNIPFLELLSVLYLSRCHNKVNTDELDKPYWSNYEDLNYEKYLEQSISIWEESSNKIYDFLNKKNIPYIHVIQPNQYQEGSKIFSNEEINKINVLNYKYYGEHIKKHYEKLNKMKLKTPNVSDFRFIFKNEASTIYADKCCHYNQKGNIIISKEIISQNYDIFKALLK